MNPVSGTIQSRSASNVTRSVAMDEAVEKILRRDPSGVYVRSDPRTQRQYHATLAEWQVLTGIDRLVIARHALMRAEAARATEGADAPAAHIGYYLIGDGARALQADLSRSARVRPRIQSRGLPPALIVPLTVTLTLLLVAACIIFIHRGTVPVSAQALATIAVLPLASVYSSRIIRLLPWRRQRNLPLPRLRAEESRASNEVTLIVIPALVPSSARAHALIQRLWTLFQTHPAAEFRFVLLSDFVDSPTETSPDDEAILTALRDGISALNARTRDVLGDRFFVLHRRRTWSRTQEAWIGWERKRGKLLELMRSLQPSPPDTTFEWQFGDFRGLLSRTSIPFVISLDETTDLEPGAATELIRTAAHPLNRPIVNPTTGRVISGYTVLQPKVLFTLDTPPKTGDDNRNTSSAFPNGAKWSTGPSFYFRTLGIGAHMGAGALFHVEAYRRVIDNAFPDEIVLHHDLLDGLVGRTGEVYDAFVRQPWSRTYLAQTQRGHRWLRGIFQAIPFLRPKTCNTAAGHRHPPLTGIQRYLIAELALQELSKPASLALLLLAWTILPGSPAAWTLLACPALLLLSATLLHQIIVLPIRLSSRWERTRLNFPWGQAVASLFAQIMLVYDSFLVINALTRVVWRLSVSRKHLLDWSPRRDLDAAGPVKLSEYWRALWVSPALGALVIGALALRQPSNLPIAVPFALAWIAAPIVVGLGDRYVFMGKHRDDRSYT